MASSNPPPPVTFSTQDESEAYHTFLNEFTDHMEADAAHQYAVALVEHAIYPETRISLDAIDLKELGIRIGHRDKLLAALERLRRPTGDIATEASITFGAVVETPPEDVSHLITTATTLSGPMTCRAWKFEKDSDAVWRDWAGKRDTVQEFEATIAEEIAPIDSSLRRFFMNNKPLPFHVSNVNKKGVTYTGMLLRLPRPDLAPEHGVLEMTVGATTIHELMNRFVIIHYPGDGATEAPRLITYRKDMSVDFVDDQQQRWATLRGKGIDGVMVRLLRDSMDTFRPVLSALQLQAEFCSSLPDSYRAPDVVKAFSRIQRQASVMERSLRGNMKVLDPLRDSGAITEDLTTVINLASDLRDIAEEVQSNANDMMSLRLTMLDFKNQTNMSIFTYFSVMVAPVGVITGWFGMNFVDQNNNEYAIQGFYYGVVAFVLLLFLVIGSFLYWVNRDRPISTQDAADAALVLKDFDRDD